jgi:acyl transferase domain-containing protein
VTASPYPQDPEQIRRLAIEQWARPVRFRETIEAMYRDGVRVFLEVGPRANLTGFVRDVLKGKPFLAMSSNVHFRSGITQLNHALGLLVAHGYSVNLEALYAHRSPEKEKAQGGVRISRTLPLLNQETVAIAGLGPQNRGEGTTARTPQPSSPQKEPKARPSLQAQGSPKASAPAPIRSPFPVAPDKRERVMEEYLRTMEQFLETQETVMVHYLARQGLKTLEQQGSHAVPVEQPAGAGEQADRMVLSSEPAREEIAGIGSQAGQEKGKDLKEIFFACVSDKTGYPTDMLSENQALEADLGIDSIKRVEILGALSKHLAVTVSESAMEELNRLQTLGEILRFLEGLRDAGFEGRALSGKARQELQGEPTPEPGNPSEFPLLGEVVRTVPGKEITARRRFNLRKDLFLQDHTLGGRVSQFDETLLALPVVPVTMTLEMMAEAASRLFPWLHLVAMKDIKAYGWITLKQEEITLEVSARTTSDNDGAQAEVRTVDQGQGGAALLAEGVMLFDRAYPEAPPP